MQCTQPIFLATRDFGIGITECRGSWSPAQDQCIHRYESIARTTHWLNEFPSIPPAVHNVTYIIHLQALFFDGRGLRETFEC
ncbi:hypothetical protein PGT21_033083 [Puccinia graminis f. sp. tritici]|uniref:Uncharacterized protein n=1 Tax=Puccinia graminis f. sp. tritici TaxID=56615 RepID=A0A5B0S7B9_PUCGR|nr:hypothetical protein PGT21_033083 [Puccinia graminis f. sp. tritici]KAA1133305.1 hypothetical protein PGTUg99_022021 [Puccinia graminis f. sp. tritici]